MNKQPISNHFVFDPEKIEQILTIPQPPCISVLVNMFTAANMMKQNGTNLKRGVERALTSLESWDLDAEEKALLSKALLSLADSFKNDGSAMAIGIFVSKNIGEIVLFPFPVIECSIVAKTFEIRDVLYLQQYLEPYYTLSINKDSMHLFKGRGKSLVEITGEAFPKSHTEEYEYEHASIGSSHGYALKGFEKDKGSIVNVRLESFVKSSARNLARVIDDPHAQLVVTGPARLINEVELAYPYVENISRIDESFNGKNFNRFVDAVWEKILDSKKEVIDRTIKRISELPLNNKAEGLRSVWEAANEGRGLMLVVERDFQRMAYQLAGINSIRLHPPKGRYVVIPDAVDDVIELVRSKHGRVIFTEKGELSQYDGIVLTLRY